MEHFEQQQSSHQEIPAPSPLPPELAEFLRGYAHACLLHGTDRGTVFVLKAPRADIESARGHIPIALHHELYSHPHAPVIRLLLRLHDQPQPLAFETFINVRDAEQLEEYRDLAGQDLHRLLFYDEDLEHRLSKAVRNRAGADMQRLLGLAVRLSLGIPYDWYDFELAKAQVQERASL
jgi:hypothetical protein